MLPGVSTVYPLAIMDPNYLIAILVLVGLGIVYFLQSRHFKRMEKLTREAMNNQHILNELKSIRESLEGFDFRRVIRLLEDMVDSDGLKPVETSVPPSTQVKESKEEDRRLADMIENHLISQGYGQITLLAEMPELSEDPDIEYKVPLETHRDGVAFKGYIILRDGRIVAERIKPAYEAFP